MSIDVLSLPVTGITPSLPPPQGSVSELAAVLQPLLDHRDTAEFGWTQTWVGIDSDPEFFDVRKIWLRTTSEADKGRSHYELRLFAHDHPTLGQGLYGGGSPYQQLVERFFDGIRYGNFRDVLLARYGVSADVTLSKAGVHLADPYSAVPEIEYRDLGNGVKESTPESVAVYNAWWAENAETEDWR